MLAASFCRCWGCEGGVLASRHSIKEPAWTLESPDILEVRALVCGPCWRCCQPLWHAHRGAVPPNRQVLHNCKMIRVIDEAAVLRDTGFGRARAPRFHNKPSDSDADDLGLARESQPRKAAGKREPKRGGHGGGHSLAANASGKTKLIIPVLLFRNSAASVGVSWGRYLMGYTTFHIAVRSLYRPFAFKWCRWVTSAPASRLPVFIGSASLMPAVTRFQWWRSSDVRRSFLKRAHIAPFSKNCLDPCLYKRVALYRQRSKYNTCANAHLLSCRWNQGKSSARAFTVSWKCCIPPN